jgi:hypothetical protein
MDTAPMFSGSLTRDVDALRLSYVVRNDGDKELGLFNVLPDVEPDGTLALRASTAYVDIGEGTLHISKLVLPLPEGLRMAERPIPYVTRVPRGGEFTEEIVLRVPVSVNSPFRRASLEASAPEGTEVIANAPAVATTVTLSIGAFVCEPTWKLIPLAPEFPDVYRIWPPGPAVDAQRILTLSWPGLEPVPVLDYAVVAWVR